MHRKLLVFLLLTISLKVLALEDPVVVQPKKFEKPLREISLIYTEEGFYPEKLSVFAGEKVRLFLTATTKQPGCLLMPEKEVFLSAEKGKVSEADLYFEGPGVHKFYCPNGKVYGRLTVLERPEVTAARKRRELKRDIASKKPVVKIWRPREESY